MGGLGVLLVHAQTSRATDGLLNPVPGPPRHLPGVTDVNLGDGAATSFWLDAWSATGALAAALPALFPHCTDPHITVAAAFRSDVLMLPLQSRLSSVATEELAALNAKLAGLRLGAAPVARHLLWGAERGFRSSAVYKMQKSTSCSVPLADVNWHNFSPVKVRVFFWILHHSNTRTRSFLYRYGTCADKNCPFCPARRRTSPTFYSNAPV
jgi:hypothetical protein